MIFRRIADHLREQNWTALALEFLLLVLGVFLGLQAQEWAKEREARAEERALLAGLRSEFVEARAEMARQVDKHRRIDADLDYLVEALARAERDGAAHATVLDARAAWALVGTTTQLSQGELRGTLSAGRLALIRDEELRSALADWDSVLADVIEDEVESRALIARDIEPLLWRSMDARGIRDYDTLYDASPRSTPPRSSKMPVDRELLGALATRRFWLKHTIREFEGPMQEATRIVGLIDASLGDARATHAKGP